MQRLTTPDTSIAALASRTAVILAVVILTCVPAKADLTVGGDTVPVASSISDAGGPIGGDLIIGDDGVGGMFMDSAPPLFDPLAPVESDNGIIGNNEGSIGAVTLEDFLGGDWIVNNDFTVGRAGEGFLDIFDSGSVTVANRTTLGTTETGSGIATINGQGSRIYANELVVGDLGYGNLKVTDRATLASGRAGGTSIIGNQDGCVGIVEVTDIGSRWTVGNTSNLATLTIGNGDAAATTAQGTLKIAEQALVQVSDYVTINQLGRVELQTKGRLRILPSSPTSTTSGGPTTVATITNNGVILGDGYVDFSSNATSTTTHDFYNGPTGEIRNQGNYVTPDFATYQREKLIFTGSLLTNDGLIESQGGEMEFNTLVDNNAEIIARDAVMRFSGGITNSGEVALGGETTVYGDVTSTDNFIFLPDSSVVLRGTFTIDPGALVAFTVGQMASTLDVIGETIVNGGYLRLSYSKGGVASQAGDTYQLLTASAGITMNAPLANPVIGGNPVTLADGRLWNIDIQPNFIQVTATGVTVIPGDFDFDGDVDGADFLAWQLNPGIGSLADWLGRYPTPLVAVSTAAASAVPEPSTLVLFGWVMAGGLWRRKR